MSHRPCLHCYSPSGAELRYWLRFGPTAEFGIDIYDRATHRRREGCSCSLYPRELREALIHDSEALITETEFIGQTTNEDVKLHIVRVQNGFTFQFLLCHRPVTHCPAQPAFFSLSELAPLFNDLVEESAEQLMLAI